MPKAPDAVSKVLASVKDLPSLPAVALEIVRLTEDENCTLDQLARVLSRDPALASKVLRFANSSLYNPGTPASSLQRATMILGTRAVKLMSLSFSLAGSLPSRGSGPFPFRTYWRRSLVCAVVARSVAERVASRLTEEAFLCGLLSRIGQLVLGHCLPDRYAKVLRAAGKRWPLPEQERAVLGCDGYEVGCALLRSWSLPDLLCEAVASVPDPSRLSSSAPKEAVDLARILRSATLCEEVICGPDPEEALKKLVGETGSHHSLPLEELEEFLGQVGPAVAEAAASLEVDVDPVQTVEILGAAQRLLANESLGIASEAQQTRQYAARLEARNRALSDKALTDALTGLHNRAAFDASLAACTAERRERRRGQALGLLIIDVDHFKSFNDRYGHRTGDAVLRMIGGALRNATREGEIACRYGGEEFAVILPEVAPEGLSAVAERIRAAVQAARIEDSGASLSVTVSVGGAWDDGSLGLGPDPASELVESADRRLYEAKRAGRNVCRVGPAKAV
jgi:diguanylate cyclase (GGDEF)-like protein